LPKRPILTIHRGTHQIGGCVTEIAYGRDRVFIDVGADLPGAENPGGFAPVEGLTSGDTSRSALCLTHYHEDHIGRLPETPENIPVHMGHTAKAILMNYAARVKSDCLPRYENIKTFFPLEKITAGEIAVTPLLIDHSAFDAYMFVVEAGGKRVLCTGDFRLHGFRGGKTLKMLSCYASGVDYIVCEGTMLSRSGEKIISERELQKRVRETMRGKKYIFVLCSSTNIDRIGSFYHASPRRRLFICDQYQKSQLETVRLGHSAKSGFYDFRYACSYARNLDDLMEKKGFCMMARAGGFFKQFLDKYKDDSLLIYSMWPGYLEGQAENRALAEFIAPYKYEILHTSGHATPDDIAKLCRAVKPKAGVIPIHTEAPDAFKDLLPENQIILPRDGEALIL
jgi:ribonuclease J